MHDAVSQVVCVQSISPPEWQQGAKATSVCIMKAPFTVQVVSPYDESWVCSSVTIWLILFED